MTEWPPNCHGWYFTDWVEKFFKDCGDCKFKESCEAKAYYAEICIDDELKRQRRQKKTG